MIILKMYRSKVFMSGNVCQSSCTVFISGVILFFMFYLGNIQGGESVAVSDQSDQTLLMNKDLRTSLVARLKDDPKFAGKIIDEDNKRTVFHMLVLSGDEELVGLVLDKKLIDVDSKCADGSTALHLAVDINSENMVELLLSHNADTNCKDRSGQTPLQCSINHKFINITGMLGNWDTMQDGIRVFRSNDIGKIKSFLQKKEANWTDQIGNGVFHYAAKYSDAAVLTELQATASSVDQANKAGITPIMYSAMYSNQPAFNWLLKNKANVSIRDTNTNSLVYYVIVKRNLPMLITLVDNGASLYKVDTVDNWSALHLAADTDNLAIMSWVLSNHSKMSGALDSQGRTAMFWVKSAEAIDLLYRNKLRIDAEDTEGRTPLMLAVAGDKVNLASTFIEKGADINHKDKDGSTIFDMIGFYPDMDTLLKKTQSGLK